MDFPLTAPVEQLDQISPEYSIFAREWNHLDLLNSGGTRLRDSGSIDQLLVKRPKEPTEVYQQRVGRFTYQPILPTAARWYGAKLFERAPEIDGLPDGDPFWQSFQANCDRAGTSFVNALAKMFDKLFLFGSAYVLTDLPKQDASQPAPVTRADQVNAGLLNPYVCVYGPDAVINCKCDSYGALEWAVLKTETQDTPFLGKPDTITEWRYFDRQNFAVYQSRKSDQVNAVKGEKVQARLIDSGDHCLAAVQRVPLRRHVLPESQWIANAVYLQLIDHLNQDNSYAWALFNANLAMPLIIGEDPGPMTVSEIGMIWLKAGSTFQWTEPEGKSFAHAERRLSSLRQEIFRGMQLTSQGQDSTATADGSSGYSKEMNIAPAKDMLVGYGDKMREVEMLTLLDVADAQALTATDKPSVLQISVRWPAFDQAIVIDEIAVAQDLEAMDIQSDDLYMESHVRVMKAYLQDSPEDVKTAAEKQIRAMPRSKVKEAEQQAMLANFQNSFATGTGKAAAREVAQAA